MLYISLTKFFPECMEKLIFARIFARIFSANQWKSSTSHSSDATFSANVKADHKIRNIITLNKNGPFLLPPGSRNKFHWASVM